MTLFTKYDEASGNIEFIFEGRPSDVELNQPCLEGAYSAKEYTVVNGKPVRRPDAEIDAVDIEQAWLRFRERRDGYLKECDWVTGRAYERKEEVPAEWVAYRDALRDLPSNTADPRNVIWPTPPYGGRYNA